MQREEILTLQSFLRDWYGILYQPSIPASAVPMIDILEQAQPGHPFNHAFLEVFSHHHFTLLQPVNGCLTGSELKHFDLRRFCTNMWHAQMGDIDEMRHELERHYGIVDFQPFTGAQPLSPDSGGPRGQHSGPEAP